MVPNSVHYFVTYYDYYQPEAYIPQRDIYIEKDASINAEIDRLRLAATSSLVSRRDVIIVASVSSIYGLGSPEDYKQMMVSLKRGLAIDRDEMLAKLVDIQYERNDVSFERGKFRVRGDCVELWPTYEEFAFRIEFWGDEVESLSFINPISGETLAKQDQLFIYPAKHFVAARSGGFHFRHDGTAWRDTRDSTELFAKLASLIANLPVRRNRPVYVCVRSYQAWLEPVLADLGAQGGDRQAVMVKHLAHLVKELQTAPPCHQARPSNHPGSASQT